MSDDRDEDQRREPKIGSDRAFGLVMAGAFLLIAGIGFWTRSGLWPAWVALALAFALAAWVVPRALNPLNRAWFRFGLVLHRIVSPLVWGAIFFLVLTPIGLLARLGGKKFLELRFQPDAKSYWVSRDTTKPSSMTNQF